jgi:1-deoxy-D-xylulose-5-phosphate synthase
MAFVKPLDEALLHKIFKTYQAVVTIEDGTVVGGFGSNILAFANSNGYKQHIEVLGIADKFIEHGSVHQLQQLQHLDSVSIKQKVEHLLALLNNS